MSEQGRSKFPEKTPQEYLLEEEALSSNSERRTPITVCIDCSFSMLQQRRLERVMEGLADFCRDMAVDPIASQSVELCIVSFGGEGAFVEQDFTAPDRIQLPRLRASGETPLADAVMTALANLDMRKRRYADNGNSYFRPWLIVIGDGDETQSAAELEKAAAVLKAEYENKRLSVLCVTVGDKDHMECDSLMKLSPERKVHYLRDLKFREFFNWLSRSIQKTTLSMSGEEVFYDPTTTWGEILGQS